MGGCRCSYKNCPNTTKSAENIRFFHFPVKHRERCIVWIENACKTSYYDLEEEQLRSKVICEEHFESKWFPNSQSKRLLQGAVPSLDGKVSSPKAPISRDIDVDSDTPIYLTNQYNDVKVVPANDDGTVFVLDTDNMFTISPKIESYIIKNGVIVPATSNGTTQGKFTKQSTLNRFTKPSTNTSGYVMGAETEIANINASPGPSKSLLKVPPLYQLDFNKKDVFESHHEVTHSGQNSTDNGEHSDYVDEQPGPSDSINNESKPDLEQRKTLGKSNSGRGQVKTNISKNYLMQLKQHGREIAIIKRMLRQKRTIEQPTKTPDRKTILSVLQTQIPPTLHSILSLLLGEKNELNDDDVEFFTTLHGGSAEMYQMLSEKYKWNLPSVDVDIVGTHTQ